MERQLKPKVKTQLEDPLRMLVKCYVADAVGLDGQMQLTLMSTGIISTWLSKNPYSSLHIPLCSHSENWCFFLQFILQSFQ